MPGNRRKKISQNQNKKRPNIPYVGNAGPSTAATSSTKESEDASAEGGFEKELCWCVEQLELGLATQKPSAKQAEDAMKLLKVLKNPKASLVRKRQVMRNTFGDYRQKIAQEEKKALADAKGKMKVNPAAAKTLQQSVFYKRSRTHKTQEPAPCFTMAQTNNSFRFDFKEQDNQEESLMEASTSTSQDEKVLPPFVFQPSSESFKFNFSAVSPSQDNDSLLQTTSSFVDQKDLQSTKTVRPTSNKQGDSDERMLSSSEDSTSVNASSNIAITKDNPLNEGDVCQVNLMVDADTHLDNKHDGQNVKHQNSTDCIPTNKTSELISPSDADVPLPTSGTYCKVNFEGGDFRFNFQGSPENNE